MLEIYQRATGIDARMEMLVRNQIVEDETIFLTVYRFIQEALTNAFQHGQATEVIVRLQKNSEWLIISVHDNGSGLTTVTEGIGLQGMRERIDFLGGDISYESSIGFTVFARIPIQVDQHED
jgi:two-component system sensor histidine kinase UhpB